MSAKKNHDVEFNYRATIKNILQQTHDIFADGFQVMDLLSLTAVIMRIIQLEGDLKGKGSVKKDIAILVFTQFLRETNLFTPEQSQEAAKFLVNSLPNIIDTMKTLSRSIQEKTKKWCCC